MSSFLESLDIRQRVVSTDVKKPSRTKQKVKIMRLRWNVPLPGPFSVGGSLGGNIRRYYGLCGIHHSSPETANRCNYCCRILAENWEYYRHVAQQTEAKQNRRDANAGAAVLGFTVAGSAAFLILMAVFSLWAVFN